MRRTRTDVASRRRLLATLPDGSEKNTPYQQGLPYQRSRFGLTLLNRSHEAISLQTSYESTESAKIALAKSLRDEEKARLIEVERERERVEEERKVKLGEQRKILRLEAEGWMEGVVGGGESEDEGRVKKRKSKKKEDGGESGEEEKPKKKKKVSFSLFSFPFSFPFFDRRRREDEEGADS